MREHRNRRVPKRLAACAPFRLALSAHVLLSLASDMPSVLPAHTVMYSYNRKCARFRAGRAFCQTETVRSVGSDKFGEGARTLRFVPTSFTSKRVDEVTGAGEAAAAAGRCIRSPAVFARRRIHDIGEHTQAHRGDNVRGEEKERDVRDRVEFHRPRARLT